MIEYHPTQKLRWVHRTISRDTVIAVLQQWWTIEPSPPKDEDYLTWEKGEWRNVSVVSEDES